MSTENIPSMHRYALELQAYNNMQKVTPDNKC